MFLICQAAQQITPTWYIICLADLDVQVCTLRNIFTACTRTCCLYEKLILFLSIELLLKELVRYLSGFGLFLEELKKSSVSFLFIEQKLTKLPVPRLFCLALKS